MLRHNFPVFKLFLITCARKLNVGIRTAIGKARDSGRVPGSPNSGGITAFWSPFAVPGQLITKQWHSLLILLRVLVCVSSAVHFDDPCGLLSQTVAPSRCQRQRKPGSIPRF